MAPFFFSPSTPEIFMEAFLTMVVVFPEIFMDAFLTMVVAFPEIPGIYGGVSHHGCGVWLTVVRPDLEKYRI